MEFNSVYKVLQEVFPQVDSRMLRAVAIEHAEDADTAVEVVLLEVIPGLSEKSPTVNSLNKNRRSVYPSEGDGSSGNLDSTAIIEPVTIGSNNQTSFHDSDGGFGTVFDGVDINKVGSDCASSALISENGSFNNQDQGCVTNGGQDGELLIKPSGSVQEEATLHVDCESLNQLPKSIDSTSNQLWANPGSAYQHQECLTNGGKDVRSFSKSSGVVQEEAALHAGSESLNQLPKPIDPTSSQLWANLDSASSSLFCENGFRNDHDQECVTNGGQDVESFSKPSEPVQEEAALHVESEPSNQMPKPFDLTSSQLWSNPDMQLAGNFHSASSSLICENGCYNIHDQECVTSGGLDVESLSKPSLFLQEVAALHIKSEPSNQLTEPSSPRSSQLVANPEMQFEISDEFDAISSSKDALVTEMVNLEDESTMNSVITRSSQICSTDLLEEIIEDARNSKKILVSAMESVVDVMRVVECKEKAAEQAKEEAGRGVYDTNAKVDELKQALWRAKEANDMHAGEVYAEKAILATEVKELQLRLLNLSDERNKSLGILDEMRQALEIRLAASLKEIEAAEQEKHEKERFAREALAYQESQMEKVVEESKRLKLEAEENSKLQEFLMDRGHAIDVLQGEISVKCQDVKLLKEKFDKRMPLGRSLSSSLASSASSETRKKKTELGDSYGFLENSSRSEQAHLPDPLIESVCSVDDQFPSGEEKPPSLDKALLEDGWELFDNGDYSA